MTLHELLDRLSPGLDLRDADLVAEAWRRDRPDDLAQVLALADAGTTDADLDADNVALQHAIAMAHQARYGNPSKRPAEQVSSWRDIGYTTEPADGKGWPEVELDDPATTPFAQVKTGYDVVVIGSGCGAIAAKLAAEDGATVLLVEAGPWMGRETLTPDALRNQRLGTGLETPAGPPLVGWPRVVGEPGVAVGPAGPGWGNNAFTLGGGLRVYGAQAWRFAAEDFTMATTYGVPEGSSLADWPFAPSELDPWYAIVEDELGVSGDPTGNRFAGTDVRYPMPPTPLNRSGELLARAAEQLGWPTSRVPLLVNSVARDGRPACRSCGACVGFPCRAEAKNGTHNTVLPEALATGRCDLVLQTRAVRLECGADGRVTGVVVADVTTGEQRTINAGRVVLAAGAVESARLLLLSTTDDEPTGLGNRSDQVGRHLQSHLYPGALGLTDEVVQEGIGPGPTVSVNHFRHGNPGLVGGGMLANDFVPLPQFTLALLSRTGILPTHGAEVHEGLSHHYRRHIMVFGPVQEVPNPDSRVRLDPSVRDHLGVPVVRLEGSVHPEDLRTAEFMMERAAQWVGAAGCHTVVPMRVAPRGPSVGQHQAGTCRMGDDPATSVVDPRGRVWGHPNLYVADTSVHVTNGGVNPVHTGLALAWRTSALMLQD
ncbi:GMC family oxidoreductase [Aestuariimicrobium ganziense]|uniref:GMC family oxidoreductase n=1 Tax=Aestuariimicrobium ganziense TaxID=2773677 RepID=UPI0019422954|nr:GMC family oxidoreductase [Aestuariimicrobium ganziense]